MKIVFFKSNRGLFRKLFTKIKIKLGFIDDVHYINVNETLPPPLTKDEEQEIIFKISNGNQ